MTIFTINCCDDLHHKQYKQDNISKVLSKYYMVNNINIVDHIDGSWLKLVQSDYIVWLADGSHSPRIRRVYTQDSPPSQPSPSISSASGGGRMEAGEVGSLLSSHCSFLLPQLPRVDLSEPLMANVRSSHSSPELGPSRSTIELHASLLVARGRTPGQPTGPPPHCLEGHSVQAPTPG